MDYYSVKDETMRFYDNEKIDLRDDVYGWMELSGQMEEMKPERLSALYFGLQLEELAEKLHAVELFNSAEILSDIGKALKNGYHDERIKVALSSDKKREMMLDADIDLTWVTIGASIASGFDFKGGWVEVSDCNYDKFREGVLKDVTGKIRKPADWQGPNLAPFVRY